MISVLKNFSLLTSVVEKLRYSTISFNNSIEVYQFEFHQQKIDSSFTKSSMKIWQLIIFQARNWFMWNEKFVYVLNYLKIFKAGDKNNQRTHSPHQKKPYWRQLPISKSLLPYGRRDNNRLSLLTKKGVFSLKQKKWTPPFLNYSRNQISSLK